MKEIFIQKIITITQADSITEMQVIQSLWSGYGQIIRCILSGSDRKSVVVKFIDLKAANTHPRGWNSTISHERKVQSYRNEISWYANYNHQLPQHCKTPKCLGHFSVDQQTILILEDADMQGFPIRKEVLTCDETKVVLDWLAQFHGYFIHQKADDLWEKGAYWHLATRPDEWKAIENKAVQMAAPKIDQKLSAATYQTLIHGDAKLANFCFPTSPIQSVIAVDFQYTGKGIGMSDVAYFLGSCIPEEPLNTRVDELLNHYFQALEIAVKEHHPHLDFAKLEKEWRPLFPYAWADFTRFLLGWMPTHPKLNGYSFQVMENVLLDVNKKENA